MSGGWGGEWDEEGGYERNIEGMKMRISNNVFT
jgi:hypothetical protein